MAKPRESEDREPAPAENTRVFTDILDMAREVCLHTRLPNGKRLKLADYLDRLLRGPISRDWSHLMDWLQEHRRKKQSANAAFQPPSLAAAPKSG